MSRLTVEAINPVLDVGWSRWGWLVRASRWELTCGFCRCHFKDTGWMVRSAVLCPACGTRNLLPLAPRIPRAPRRL